ncbi:MAG: hypothetical protein H8D45_20830 [Bacteroidetes bacterium]|nr:hypothetical protein [Bacteroidota bacterium]
MTAKAVILVGLNIDELTDYFDYDDNTNEISRKAKEIDSLLSVVIDNEKEPVNIYCGYIIIDTDDCMEVCHWATNDDIEYFLDEFEVKFGQEGKVLLISQIVKEE